MPVRAPTRSATRTSRRNNNVQRLREELLLTKAELARKAGISALTVARVEAGLTAGGHQAQDHPVLGLQPVDAPGCWRNSPAAGRGVRDAKTSSPWV
jgi:DNA-binding XRE family transcriptional regulator